MSILTHDEAKRLSQSSTDPLEVIRNVEAAVIIKLAGSQVALKDEIRLIWQPKCDALRQQLEALQAEVKHLNLHPKATQSGRDAALARLAITEEANSMLLARNKWLEHALEVAGASPVEPSQAQPPAPSDTAREYMTGYSDAKEWAKPSQAVELSDDEIDALLPTITLKGLDPKQQVWLTKKDAIAFASAISAAIKQGGQHD